MKLTEYYMVKQVIRNKLDSIVYRNKGNKFECYCPECQKTYLLTKQQLNEVKNSHLCPECFSEIRNTTSNTVHRLGDAVGIFDSYPSYEGFYVTFTLKFNRAVKVKCKKVVDRHFNKTMVRDIHLGAYGHPIIPDSSEIATGKWRTTKSEYYFYCLSRIEQPKFLTKKEYLESVFGSITRLKSNQFQIAKDHLMNKNQLLNMYGFNINDYEIAKKCKFEPYRRNAGYLIQMNMNKYDALYIQKTGIDVQSYIDYIEQCKILNIKNKHPKDFQEEHEKLSKIISKQKQNDRIKSLNTLIAEVSKNLPTYKKGEFIIEPFRSAEEIKENAKVMHNCIYSNYLKDYALNQTHLYKVTCNEKLIANVEIVNGHIIQVRAKYNKEPSKPVKDVVNLMVREVCA